MSELTFTYFNFGIFLLKFCRPRCCLLTGIWFDYPHHTAIAEKVTEYHQGHYHENHNAKTPGHIHGQSIGWLNECGFERNTRSSLLVGWWRCHFFVRPFVKSLTFVCRVLFSYGQLLNYTFAICLDFFWFKDFLNNFVFCLVFLFCFLIFLNFLANFCTYASFVISYQQISAIFVSFFWFSVRLLFGQDELGFFSATLCSIQWIKRQELDVSIEPFLNSSNANGFS